MVGSSLLTALLSLPGPLHDWGLQVLDSDLQSGGAGYPVSVEEFQSGVVDYALSVDGVVVVFDSTGDAGGLNESLNVAGVRSSAFPSNVPQATQLVVAAKSDQHIEFGGIHQYGYWDGERGLPGVAGWISVGASETADLVIAADLSSDYTMESQAQALRSIIDQRCHIAATCSIVFRQSKVPSSVATILSGSAYNAEHKLIPVYVPISGRHYSALVFQSE